MQVRMHKLDIPKRVFVQRTLTEVVMADNRRITKHTAQPVTKPADLLRTGMRDQDEADGGRRVQGVKGWLRVEGMKGLIIKGLRGKG